MAVVARAWVQRVRTVVLFCARVRLSALLAVGAGIWAAVLLCGPSLAPGTATGIQQNPSTVVAAMVSTEPVPMSSDGIGADSGGSCSDDVSCGSDQNDRSAPMSVDVVSGRGPSSPSESPIVDGKEPGKLKKPSEGEAPPSWSTNVFRPGSPGSSTPPDDGPPAGGQIGQPTTPAPESDAAQVTLNPFVPHSPTHPAAIDPGGPEDNVGAHQQNQLPGLPLIDNPASVSNVHLDYSDNPAVAGGLDGSEPTITNVGLFGLPLVGWHTTGPPAFSPRSWPSHRMAPTPDLGIGRLITPPAPQGVGRLITPPAPQGVGRLITPPAPQGVGRLITPPAPQGVGRLITPPTPDLGTGRNVASPAPDAGWSWNKQVTGVPGTPEADPIRTGLPPYIDLYHGTAARYAEAIHANGIDLSKATPRSDFGPGFYLTKYVDQARRTIGWKYPHEPGGILRYQVPVNELRALNGKSFDSPDEAWQSFVRGMRTQSDPMHDYDWVEGPLLWNPWKWLEGEPLDAHGHQLSVHTPDAVELFNGSLLEHDEH